MCRLTLTTRDGLQLRLHRLVAPDKSHVGRRPVLLLHGASANHRTFMTPDGGLAAWLATGGGAKGQSFEPFDVWLLDWRASSDVVEDRANASYLDKADVFNFNAAAKHDIRLALDYIVGRLKDEGTSRPIYSVGFCMGAAILAEAIALGHLERYPIERAVLMAMALFYDTPIDGRLKSEERVLERLRGTALPDKCGPFVSMDPRVTAAQGAPSRLSPKTIWPRELEEFYATWPRQLRFHLTEERTPVEEMCNRLSFMLGMFYEHDNLVESIHGGTNPSLEGQFGPMALHLFIHGARNVRVGHATYYRPQPGQRDDDFVTDAARRRFAALDRVTLITGARNRLWHRDSIDRMHEWLCREPSGARRFPKHVLRNYGHQDLLWGKQSERDVFQLVERALA